MQGIQLSIIDLELLEAIESNGVVCLCASKDCENLYRKYKYKSQEIAFRRMQKSLKKMWVAGIIKRKIIGISYFQGLPDTKAKRAFFYYKGE
jgi:hypothetical protein